MKSYQDINKETIDRWVEEGWEWANRNVYQVERGYENLTERLKSLGTS